jgi:hypothetical protein
VNTDQKLMEALRKAKARRQQVNPIPPEMGKNQHGPPPETNAPPNGWPQDGENF